jgi:hypothetical protein
MGILYSLLVVANIACLVMVLLKLFPAEGPLKGILGIICGLYTYIWGWMNSSRFNLKTIMLVWTAVIILQMLMAGMMGFSAFSSATSGM